MKKRLILVTILLVMVFVFSGCDFFGPDSDVSSVILAFDIDGQGEIIVDSGQSKDIEVEKGAVVNLEAVPSEGWEFKKWIGDVQNKTNSSTSILMDKDKEVTAVFKEKATGPDFKVEITETNSPITEGEELEVKALVENIGDEEGSQDIELIIGELRDQKEITVPAGESYPITLSWNTEEGDAGDYNAKVSSEDDSDSVDVAVNDTDPDPAYFEVTIDGTNSPITEGERLDVDVTVENTGDESGTEQIDLLIDDTQKDSDTVSLSGGESTSFTLSWDTEEGDAGDYNAVVFAGDSEDSVNVTVNEKTVDPEEYDLQIAIDGEGTTNPSEGIHTYNEGQEASITATPASGWKFNGWTGDYTSSNSEITITMDEDKSIVANFVEEDPDPEVSFSYEKISGLEYEFTATEPEGAYYYEWKFPELDHWRGRIEDNTITHEFDDYGDKLVKLEIYDQDDNLIGSYEKTVSVSEAETVTLTLSSEEGGSVTAQN